jgi:hypothetical protein
LEIHNVTVAADSEEAHESERNQSHPSETSDEETYGGSVGDGACDEQSEEEPHAEQKGRKLSVEEFVAMIPGRPE